MDDKILGQLAMLLGGKIEKLVRGDGDEADQFGLLVKLSPIASKSMGCQMVVIWFFSDFEGNGPGGFDIQPYENS